MSKAKKPTVDNGSCTFTFVNPPPPGTWVQTTDNCTNGAHCDDPNNSIPLGGLTTAQLLQRVATYNAHVTAAGLDLPLIAVPNSPPTNQTITMPCL
jgi:hypothetical protein